MVHCRNVSIHVYVSVVHMSASNTKSLVHYRYKPAHPYQCFFTDAGVLDHPSNVGMSASLSRIIGLSKMSASYPVSLVHLRNVSIFVKSDNLPTILTFAIKKCAFLSCDMSFLASRQVSLALIVIV